MRLGPDLDPDDVCRCVVCWDPCSPAPAAAKAYNRLNGYVAEHGDKPAQLITGALGMDLDAAAKFELLCPVCAALVRELEEREQQVQLLRGQLLERFTRSQQLLQPPAAEEKEPAEEGETERQEDEVQAALKALRADAQHGMFGIAGLGLPLPEPPPTVRYIISGEGDVLPREEDTVEAYLSRRDEWITQTPGAAGSGYPFKRELRNHEFLKHGLHGEIPRDSDHRPGEMYRCGNCGRCFGSWAGRDRHTCDSAAPLSDLYVCQLCGDWSTRFEGDMVKHMRNLHKIEAETILIADIEDDGAAAGGQEDAAVAEEEENEEEEDEPPPRPNILTSASRVKVKDDQ
ncbi:hypothetical protein FJT64_021467 [Amphibalanus amphitrite]|uniref:Uncharacterized protein n=1 Tax=Amphibalanus amphitrite TaxID=1232801 RepID=A0A6A4WM27_AMPAM|nr:hypothetical protein FJT64_021467 [Amphibalanus amphitrite]